MNLTKNQRYALIAVLILAMVGTAASLSPVIYEGGWEVKSGIHSVRVNQYTFDAENLPEYDYAWGTAYVKFDTDTPKRGIPTLTVDTAAPVAYVSQYGEWVKAREGEYFAEIQKEVDDDIYFFYHHVFFQDIRIIAEGDYDQIIGGTVYGDCRHMNDAIEPTISVRLLIDAGLWNVLSSITSDNGEAVYVNDGVWTGVMSASIGAQPEAGYVEDLPDGFAGIHGSWSVTQAGRLNMYYVEGDLAGDTEPTQFETNPSLIEGVPSEVYVDVSGTRLQPGWWWPWLGSVGTYAVYADYRIRFDIVTSAKYTFQQGDQDDTLRDAVISKEASEGGLGLFADWLNSVFSNPWTYIGGLVVLVAVVVVVIKVVPAVLRGGR